MWCFLFYYLHHTADGKLTIFLVLYLPDKSQGIRDKNRLHTESETNDAQLFNALSTPAAATHKQVTVVEDAALKSPLEKSFIGRNDHPKISTAAVTGAATAQAAAAVAAAAVTATTSDMQETTVPTPPPPSPPNTTTKTSEDDKTSIDGMLDRISHDLDYLLNRTTGIPAEVRHCHCSVSSTADNNECTDDTNIGSSFTPHTVVATVASVPMDCSCCKTAGVRDVSAIPMPLPANITSREVNLPPIVEESSMQIHNEEVQI